MIKILKKIVVFWCFGLGSFVIGQYEPPEAKVEPLSPKGLRISVPNEPGMTLVAFHVKFNEDFEGLEAGTIAKDITRIRNGRWTFEDRSIKLRNGDIIYYWIHVIYKGLGYNLLDQQHKVTEFFSVDNGAKVSSGSKDEGSENRPCAPTSTQVIDLESGGRKRNICAGQLLLHDTFDHLNRSVWTENVKFTGPPDYAFVVFRKDEKNVKSVDGNLKITATLVGTEMGEDFIRHGNLSLERCTGESGSVECQREALGAYILPPLFSGLVDTKNNFAFIYGKIEIRAKLPRGDWIYPVISLERLDKSSRTLNHPQMRVASSSGNPILRGPDGQDFSGHVLSGGPIEMNLNGGGPGSLAKRYSSGLWSDDYHVYELEWGRDKILSRVDGIEYGSAETGSAFDKPFFLSLGVAVGGHSEFPDSCLSDGYAKPWRNVGSKALFDFFNATDLWSRTWNSDLTSLKIDYIKVWAL